MNFASALRFYLNRVGKQLLVCAWAAHWRQLRPLQLTQIYLQALLLRAPSLSEGMVIKNRTSLGLLALRTSAPTTWDQILLTSRAVTTVSQGHLTPDPSSSPSISNHTSYKSYSCQHTLKILLVPMKNPALQTKALGTCRVSWGYSHIRTSLQGCNR